jgi:hypothetical protein
MMTPEICSGGCSSLISQQYQRVEHLASVAQKIFTLTGLCQEKPEVWVAPVREDV